MKKVLSFVLILALVLGSFSFAFGLTDVTDATSNSEAITVVNDLGIVEGFPDGSFKPDQDVTRAEFAAMMTRALGVPASALAGFSSTSFKDTSGYGWAVKYLAFCESKGIMIGDGYGNVMPGRTINVNEAMTMILRAVGYTENSALLVGTWPSKYVTIAQDLGLYDDVAATVMVDRANAAQIIYNALTVQKVQVDADGQTNGIKDKDGNPVNMLTAGLNAKVYDGGNAWVVEGDEDSVINLTKYVGAYVTAYMNSKDDIVAINEVKSTFLTGNLNSTSKFTTTADTEYTISAYSYNADVTGAGVVKTFINGVYTSPASFAATDEVVIAAKVSGKKLLEVYSVNKWDATAVKWTKDMLDEEDATINGVKFVKNDNDDIDYGSFQLIGVKSLSDIKVDNVVSIFESTTKNGVYAANEVVKVAVGTKTVEGKIERITADGEVVIKGVKYELSQNMTKPNVSNLGQTGVAYLDYEGKVAFWNEDGSAVGNYAVLVATGSATDFATTYKVKLFTGEGTIITPTLDGASFGGIAIGELVEFSLNNNGKVDVLDRVNTKPLTGKVAKDGSVIGTVPVVNNPVVFVYDSSKVLGDEDAYSLSSVLDLDTSQALQVIKPGNLYGENTDLEIDVLWVYDDVVAGGDDTYGVINATSAGIDANGDKKVYVTGFIGSEPLGAYTNYNSLNSTRAATTFANGLQLIVVNNDGVVTSYGNLVAGDVHTSVMALTAGSDYVTVTGISGKIMTVSGAGVNGLAVAGAYRIADNAKIYVYDGTDFELKTSTSVLKNKTNIKLYQSDEDVIGFDYILVY